MTITEVSKRYDISADTLRYYERIGLIPPVPRSAKGIRNYDETSCNWIELIKCFRGAGVQVEALIEYRRLYEQGDATLSARRQLLADQRELLVQRIAGLESSLERLDKKLEMYDVVISDKKDSALGSSL